MAGTCSSQTYSGDNDFAATTAVLFVPNKSLSTISNFANNVIADVCEHLRDPNNLDFRPSPDSGFVTKGIGPYGKEPMGPGGMYWM